MASLGELTAGIAHEMTIVQQLTAIIGKCAGAFTAYVNGPLRFFVQLFKTCYFAAGLKSTVAAFGSTIIWGSYQSRS